MQKICSKCKKIKDINLFGKAKQNKDGFNGKCKECISVYQSTYRDKYYLLNKEKLRIKHKNYYLSNKEKMDIYYKSYREEKKEQSKLYQQNYYLQNKPYINKRKQNYVNNNMDAKIKHRLRCRVSMAMRAKGVRKCKSTCDLLGCSMEQFRAYIESKFTKGMSWDNYGKDGWHIDHIKSCESFDLTNSAEQKKCFHYTNLQPLWATTKIAMKYGESSNYIGNIEKGYKT